MLKLMKISFYFQLNIYIKKLKRTTKKLNKIIFNVLKNYYELHHKTFSLLHLFPCEEVIYLFFSKLGSTSLLSNIFTKK